MLGNFRKNNIIPLVEVEGYMNWLREMGEKGCVPGEEKEEEEGAKGGGGDDDITLWKNISPTATTKTAKTTTTTTTTVATVATAVAPHEPPTNLLSSATATTEAPSQPYPQSFSHLVELIRTGQPIPGIREVPNTLLTGQGSKAVESKRRKPWEIHGEEEMEIGGGEI